MGIPITPTVLLLSILLIFLLAWMVVFAYLAVRRTPEPAVTIIKKAAAVQPTRRTMQTAPSQLQKMSSVPMALQSVGGRPELAAKEVMLEQSVR